jgi:2-C-methyl-D-erythritol 2,4-cyclodiphosphate synthase
MKVGIGQDSHRFDFEDKQKKLILGGVLFDGEPPLSGNSDADVVLHAITNAISGISCVNILGKVSDKLCLEDGIKDSKVYLAKSLDCLKNYRVSHLSISIEGLIPKMSPKIPEMRECISNLLSISSDSVGITATTGEGLTAFGRGEGLQVFCIVTAFPI